MPGGTDITIADFAADVAALIEHLQLPAVHLVGISMGGMIGFQLGVDRPELLRSLTIVNSGPEVKAKNARDWLEIGKRWTLSRLLSLETTDAHIVAWAAPEASR